MDTKNMKIVVLGRAGVYGDGVGIIELDGSEYKVFKQAKSTSWTGAYEKIVSKSELKRINDVLNSALK